MLPHIVLTNQELKDLRFAKSLLEHASFAARLSKVIGIPIEKGFKMLPEGFSSSIQKTVRAALFKALEMAVITMDRTHRKKASERLHKVLVGASGGIGGVFGLPALAIELPLSTTIMLRSIADIARCEGHDLSSAEVQVSCLEVFALGGGVADGGSDADHGYWVVRTALSRAVADAAAYITEKGVLEKTAPALLRLVGAIAGRFGVIVSEQVAAKAVPLVGAAGGALINVLFIDHFQDMARGHFIVKRLETKYGIPAVKSAYETLRL
jgi:hypothetical protein